MYCGYRPLLNCCIKAKNHSNGVWYLCRDHGWKHSDIKAEGEQLQLNFINHIEETKTKVAEIFYKYIGCEDCKQQWRTRCPLCKLKGKNWKDANAKSVPSHQLTPDSLSILRHTKRDYAVLFDDRIITPPPIKVKKLKVKLKNSTKEKTVPKQPLPITWENFFIATKGNFEEIEFIPDGFESFYKSKGSEYFINEEKDKLVRKSDHWGYGIRNCNWYLKGYGFAHCGTWWKKHNEPLKIGLINISELSPSFKSKKIKDTIEVEL